MLRRLVVVAVLAAAGCSSKHGTSGPGRLPTGAARARTRMKGPQTMGGLLVTSYIDDLGSPDVHKRLRAAEELGNMGPGAQSALPALRRLTSDDDPHVSAAAQRAIDSIALKEVHSGPRRKQ